MTTIFSRLKWICGFALVLAASNRSASAWLRYYAPDDELVQRSDAIVIGHVDDSFTPFAPPPRYPNDFQCTQYRTILIVTEVLVGKMTLGPTPIVIHYGIKPVVLKDKSDFVYTINPTTADATTGPNVPVGIFDAATTCIGGPPSDNIRKDHIWFLSSKQHGGPGPGNEDISAPGIWSPQDVQTADQKAYYLAVLTGDPDALAPFVAGDSYPAQRARLAQSRLHLAKIGAIADPSARAEELMKVFQTQKLYTSESQLYSSSLNQLLNCGSAGEDMLVSLIATPDRTYERSEIIAGLGGKDYRAAIPAILDWLRQEDQWWAMKTHQDMIWTVTEGPRGGEPWHDPRFISYRTLLAAVDAMGKMNVAEAKPLIQQIRARWIDVREHEDGGWYLPDHCDSALAAMH
jgi:hypothetical protein